MICAPALRETFAARQGNGATLNGAPIRAAASTDLARGMVECGWSPRRSKGIKVPFGKGGFTGISEG